jgi:hypothetical protein
MNIIKLIESRIKNDSSRYRLIGSEIKNSRISHNQTLNELTNDICSISYGSKVENCAIIANEKYLMELCNRAYLKSSTVNSILESRKYYYIVLDALYKNDFNMFKNVIEEIKGQSNYRAKLINILYQALYIDPYKARKNLLKLESLTNSFSDEDLSFYGIVEVNLLYIENDYNEAINLIKKLQTFKILNKKYEMVLLFIMEKILFDWNLVEYIELNNYIVKNLVDSFDFEMIEYYKYRKSLFLVFNKSYKKAGEIISNLNEMHKLELESWINLFNNKDFIPKNNIQTIIHLYLFEKDFNIMYEKIKDKLVDFEISLGEYLYALINNKDDSIEVLYDLCFMKALAENKYFYIINFYQILIDKYAKMARYKRTYEITQKVMEYLKNRKY